ncbi:hypothetical protein HUO09_12745 [Vibrio sp. Y2-5]|uniref:hypothetical protein n=1 Tax=Vibrio sp. Y2-5 TaxID=2743977 RepID=UPI0016607E92|nr:hypothetical protein [Vibrio sp. Y2-5]MBD0787215.1 hypothetical protein [Vibrio sp. Y2-5]
MVANKSITQLKSLWITIVIIISLSVGSSIWIVIHSDLVYLPSYKGINNLLVIFKVPLGVLALIIPAVAIIASNHRSVQSAKQIELVNSQNNFTNYFKHREEFSIYLSKNEDVFNEPNHLHNTLYPDAIKGDLIVNKEIIESLIEYIIEFTNILSKLEIVDENFCNHLNKINEITGILCASYSINEYSIDDMISGRVNKLDFIDSNGDKKSFYIKGQPKNVLIKFQLTCVKIFEAIDFCMAPINYSENKYISAIFLMEFESECNGNELMPIYSNLKTFLKS